MYLEMVNAAHGGTVAIGEKYRLCGSWLNCHYYYRDGDVSFRRLRVRVDGKVWNAEMYEDGRLVGGLKMTMRNSAPSSAEASELARVLLSEGA